MIELDASGPFYIDDPGKECLAVGFSDVRDGERFVAFERAYRADADDGRYLDGTVSVELGFEEPLCGIYPDVVDTVRLERDRIALALKGELHGTIVIRFGIDDVSYERLEATMGVLFDGTGRLIVGNEASPRTVGDRSRAV